MQDNDTAEETGPARWNRLRLKSVADQPVGAVRNTRRHPTGSRTEDGELRLPWLEHSGAERKRRTSESDGFALPVLLPSLSFPPYHLTSALFSSDVSMQCISGWLQCCQS